MRKLVLLLAAGLLSGAAGRAMAQCSYVDLSSGVSMPVSTTPSMYRLNQGHGYWTAAGIRSAAGSDWNLEVYQSTGPVPSCVSGLLAGSTRPTGVDFVIGDFNTGHNPLGIVYPHAFRQSGGGTAVAEWDGGANSLFVNNPLTTRSTDANDVLEVWDVALSAGVPYTFTFSRSGADVKLLLFKSGAGAYWAARQAALWEATTTTTYTPSESAYYAVVVVNDDGAGGSYTVGVGACTPPQALSPGVVATTGGFAERYYSFDQAHTFWTAIGVRGAADWNLEAYASATGGAYPVCLGSVEAGSALPAPAVDVVVGNFNSKLIGTFYARAHMNQGLGGGSGAVEWDSGADFMAVGDTAVTRSTGSGDVLECWDVHLNSGGTYQIEFITSGADLKLLVFGPGLSWGRRSDALAQFTGGAGPQSYPSTQTGWHGFVVVNENGASGSYQLRVSAGALSVESDPLERPATALAGIQPNPARSVATIAFSLNEAARVGFELLDVTGRRAAEVGDEDWGPGRWTRRWRPETATGHRLAPGLYFLRMRVDGRSIGLRKVTLLD